MALGKVAGTGPNQGGVGTELAPLRDLAVVDGRNEILASLTIGREIFDAGSAKVVRSKVEVSRFRIVIDGFPLGYFVEFIGGDIVLVIQNAKVAADALVELIVVVLLDSGPRLDELLVTKDDELHLRVSSHG